MERPLTNPRVPRLPRSVAMAGLILFAAAPLTAQTPTRTLGKPDAEYAEPFTAISGLRELRDGRVIVSDSREKTLRVIDLVRGTAEPLGRAGAGPGEWGNPTTLYALPGDSTLMPDFMNSRFFIATPDGKAGAPLRTPESSPLAFADLAGSDGSGRLLLVENRRPRGPTDGSVGIADLFRFDRRSGRVDTVGTLAKPVGERTAASMAGPGRIRVTTNLPFAAQDLASMAWDGRIAIVRASPYRMEWIAPDGKHVLGPVTSGPIVRIDENEKEAFVRSQIRPGGILIRGPAASAASSAPGASSAAVASVPKLSSAEVKAMMDPNMTWPAVKPPFLGGALQVASDGRAWVLRSRAVDDSIPVYDVFDAAGRVVERVALPKRTRLAGFGKGVVYLARMDDDDLLWLQRVRR